MTDETTLEVAIARAILALNPKARNVKTTATVCADAVREWAEEESLAHIVGAMARMRPRTPLATLAQLADGAAELVEAGQPISTVRLMFAACRLNGTQEDELLTLLHTRRWTVLSQSPDPCDAGCDTDCPHS